MLKNSFFNIFNKGFNVVYPLVVAAFISRVFQADGVGEIAFAINIVTYFSIAASLGVPSYAVKLLAIHRNNKDNLNRSFSELAIIIAASSIMVTALYYLSVLLYYKGNFYECRISLVLGLILLSNIFNYDWLFEAMEDYKYLAIRSILVKIVALVLMFIFVCKKEDIVIYVFIYSMVTVVNNAINGLCARKYVSFTKKKLVIKNHFKPVAILFASAIATELYTLLDSTMLGIKCEPEYLGYYSNASRVVRAAYGLVFSTIGVYSPRLSYQYKNEKNNYLQTYQSFYDQGMLFAIPATLGMFMLSPNIVRVFFGSGYEPASTTLVILSMLIIVFTLATIFGHIPLIIYEKEKYILFSTIIGASINFILNQILIPKFQHNGAAVASVISELIVTLFLMICSLKVVRLHLINRNLFSSVVATAVMCMAILLLKMLLNNITIMLIVGIIVGVIVYASMLIILGNVYIKQILNIILNKIRMPLKNRR